MLVYLTIFLHFSCICKSNGIGKIEISSTNDSIIENIEYHDNGNIKRKYNIKVDKEAFMGRYLVGSYQEWDSLGLLLYDCYYCIDNFNDSNCNCFTFMFGTLDMLFPNQWYENGQRMHEFIKSNTEENTYYYLNYMKDGSLFTIDRYIYINDGILFESQNIYRYEK